jgi:hypothetical protein
MTDQEPKGENVSIEQVDEVARQAARDADDREEQAVDWAELIETPCLKLTEESFAGRVGQRFEIELGQRDAQVELKQVTHIGAGIELGAGAPVRSRFSLVFRGYSARANLPEGIYRLRHEELGEFEVHLRPTQSMGDHEPNNPHLEALFCWLSSCSKYGRDSVPSRLSLCEYSEGEESDKVSQDEVSSANRIVRDRCGSLLSPDPTEPSVF